MTDERRRSHWSDVLGDVADLGAQVKEARTGSFTAAAEASSLGFGADFPTIVIGPPPPRQVGTPRPTTSSGAPVLAADATVRIDARGPARVAGGVRIGTPPPRQTPARRRRIVPAQALPVGAVPEETLDVTDAEDIAAAEASGRGRRLLKDNLVVAAGTALSRVTGVARLLAVYGLAENLRDVYLQANNTPNIVYELILGGILTATLVPLFTQHLEEDDEGATNAVVSTTLVALVALTVVAFVVAPLLLVLYSTGLGEGIDVGQYRRVGIYLSVLFVPQVFFYGVMALGSALLNARRRYFAAAWAPVLNNVIVVSVLLLAGRVLFDAPDLADVDDSTALLLLLGLGTTAGIVGMALSLIPALRRAGIRLRFRPSLRHPAVRAAGGLSGWTLGYVVANQVAAQTVTVLSNADTGTFTTYQVGFVFFQLPHGLLAVSLMTTFQPDLARAYVRRAWPEFHARLLQGLRLLITVMVPAAVGYLTLSLLVLNLGDDAAAFSEGGSLATTVDWARALTGFAPGLLGFSVYLFVLRGFYAVQDTKRPFWINAVENVINIVAAVVLSIPLSLLSGLTIGYSVAYISAAAIALRVLLRQMPPGFDIKGFLSTLARCLLAATAMAAAVAGTALGVTAVDADLLLVGLVVGVPVGVVVYALAAIVLGVVRDAGLARRLPGPLGRLNARNR